MEDFLKLYLSIKSYVHNYELEDDIPVEYWFDEELNDCLFYMYYVILCQGDERGEMFSKEFMNRFEKLDQKKQIIVLKEYRNIIEAQEKNKGKIKEKGMDDYE